jgi:hypothetical protein
VLTATSSPVQVVAMIDVEMTVVMPVATTIVGQIDITGTEATGIDAGINVAGPSAHCAPTG